MMLFHSGEILSTAARNKIINKALLIFIMLISICVYLLRVNIWTCWTNSNRLNFNKSKTFTRRIRMFGQLAMYRLS